MGLFKNEDKNLHHFLKKSFANVRQDTSNLFEWVQFLHKKIQLQEGTIHGLRTQLNNSILTPRDIHDIINKHVEIGHLRNRLENVHKKIDILASLHDTHNRNMSELHARLSEAAQQVERKQSSLKEKIIRKITRNSKTYVKNLILSYIEKYQEVTALQLKEMIVEEQNICSKSSFYRLLQELEDDSKVSVVKEGKNKIYIQKLPTKN